MGINGVVNQSPSNASGVERKTNGPVAVAGHGGVAQQSAPVESQSQIPSTSCGQYVTLFINGYVTTSPKVSNRMIFNYRQLLLIHINFWLYQENWHQEGCCTS